MLIRYYIVSNLPLFFKYLFPTKYYVDSEMREGQVSFDCVKTDGWILCIF